MQPRCPETAELFLFERCYCYINPRGRLRLFFCFQPHSFRHVLGQKCESDDPGTLSLSRLDCFAQHILRRPSTGLRGPHAPHAVVPGNLGQFLSTTAALLPRSCGKCAAGGWSACTAVLTPLPATALKQSCGIDRLITAATAPAVEGYGCNEVVSSSLDC